MRRKQSKSVKSLLLRVFVIGAVAIASQAGPEISESEFSDLWSTFAKKPAPVYKCEGWYGGNKLVIPKAPDCRMPSKHIENEIVSVTLYLPDPNSQIIDGYECYSVRKTEWIWRNFLDVQTSGSFDEYISITGTACWDMVIKRQSPRGEKMDSERNGIVSTSNKLIINSYWMHNVTESVTNYFFREVSVSVFDLDQSIITSTDIKQPCTYNDTECPTTFGILVWKPSDFKTCRLMEIGPASRLYSKANESSRLTCPDLQLSMHNIGDTPMCDLIFGTTMQGYYFLKNEVGQFGDKISMSYDAIKVISKPHERQKRDLWKANNQDIFTNAKFSYLYDNLKESVEGSFQVVHNDICNTNFLLWSLSTSVAKIGYPTLLVQLLYNDPSLRAIFSGDALSVWQCETIYSYKFLPRTKCLTDWPIMYIQNGKQYSGYLMPLSHAIIDQSVEMKGPCGEFYFDAQDYYLHLTETGPKKVSLPSLHQPISLGSRHITLPNVSFYAGSGIETSIFADYMHTVTMMREIQSRIDLTQQVRDMGVQVIENSVSAFDVVTKVGSGIGNGLWSFWSNFGNFLKYVFIFGIIAIIIFLAISVSGPGILFSSFFRIGRSFSSFLPGLHSNRPNLLPQYNAQVNGSENIFGGEGNQRFYNVAPSAPVRQRYPDRHTGYISDRNY